MTAPPLFPPSLPLATRAVYRATLYAPRSRQSNPETEPDVLTPAEGAPHAEPFRIASARGVPGFKPYLRPVKGRRSRIDYKSRKVDAGQMALTVFDPRLSQAGAPSDNYTRFVTAYLHDADARAALAMCKVVVEESLTGPLGPWRPLFVGRVTGEVKSQGRLQFVLPLTDMAKELDRDIFTSRPSGLVMAPPHGAGGGAGGYCQFTPLLPNGTMGWWGNLPPSALGIKCQVNTFGDGRRRISIQRSGDTDPEFQIVGQGLVDQIASYGQTQITEVGIETVARFTPGAVRVWLTREDTKQGGWFALRTAVLWWHDVKGYGYRYRLLDIRLDDLTAAEAGGAPTMPYPANGVKLRAELYAAGGPSERNLLLVGPVHPVRFIRDLLDGRYSPLRADGTPFRAVSRKADTFAALEADASFGTCSYIVDKPGKLGEWVPKVCKEFGLAVLVDDEGDATIVDVREPGDLDALPELTRTDLVQAPDAEAYTHDGAAAVTMVAVKFWRDRTVPIKEAIGEGDKGVPDFPPGMLQSTQLTAGDLDLSPRALDYGVKPETVTFDGIRGTEPGPASDSTGVMNPARLRPPTGIPAELRYAATPEGRARALAADWGRPYAYGPEYVTLLCRRTPAADAVAAGQVAKLSPTALPDPILRTRSGARRALVDAGEDPGPAFIGRCLERTEQDGGGAVLLAFLVLGTTERAEPPTLSNLRLGVPTSSQVLVDVTRNAAGDPVALSVAVVPIADGITDPADVPAGAWGPADTTVDVDGPVALTVPSGSRIFVRGQSVPAGRLRSVWAYAPGYVDTTGVPAPVGLTVDTITRTSGVAHWTTPGASEGNPPTTRVLVYLGDVPDLATADAVPVLALDASGLLDMAMTGLLPGTLYTVFVINADGPEVSTPARVTFTTLAVVAVRPAGIGLLPGPAPAVPGVQVIGIPVTFYPAAAETSPYWLAQVAPDNGTGNGPNLGAVTVIGAEQTAGNPVLVYTGQPPGEARSLADGAVRWFRLAYAKAGTGPDALVAAGGFTCWRKGVARPLDPGVGVLPPVLPTFRATQSSAGGTGTLLVVATDPQCRLTLMEESHSVGTGAASAYAPVPPEGTVPDESYEMAVALAESAPSTINNRRTWYDADGVLVVADVPFVFGSSGRPQVPNLVIPVDPATGDYQARSTSPDALGVAQRIVVQLAPFASPAAALAAALAAPERAGRQVLTEVLGQLTASGAGSLAYAASVAVAADGSTSAVAMAGPTGRGGLGFDPDAYQLLAEKDQPGGYAGWDPDGLLVGVDSGGGPDPRTPTPPPTDRDKSIANTEWVWALVLYLLQLVGLNPGGGEPTTPPDPSLSDEYNDGALDPKWAQVDFSQVSAADEGVTDAGGFTMTVTGCAGITQPRPAGEFTAVLQARSPTALPAGGALGYGIIIADLLGGGYAANSLQVTIDLTPGGLVFHTGLYAGWNRAFSSDVVNTPLPGSVRPEFLRVRQTALGQRLASYAYAGPNGQPAEWLGERVVGGPDGNIGVFGIAETGSPASVTLTADRFLYAADGGDDVVLTPAPATNAARADAPFLFWDDPPDWATQGQRLTLGAGALFQFGSGLTPIVASEEAAQVLWVPADCDLTGWTLSGDAAGDVVLKVEAATFAAYPVWTEVWAAARPTLAAQAKAQDPGGLAPLQVRGRTALRVSVVSASGLARASLALTGAHAYA
jgi:hypothetical protein